MTAEYEERLRSLAISDERFVQSVLGIGLDTIDVSRLDAKTDALVRLGALLAIDAAPSSYQANVETAVAAGASVDEIVGAVIAVAPITGVARVVSAAPELALALGYDVDEALEARDSNSEAEAGNPLSPSGRPANPAPVGPETPSHTGHPVSATWLDIRWASRRRRRLEEAHLPRSLDGVGS